MAPAAVPPSLMAPASLREPSPPPVLRVDRPAPDEPSPPLYRRWWFWTAVGVAVLGGIAVGVALSSGSGSSLPPTELGNMRFY